MRSVAVRLASQCLLLLSAGAGLAQAEPYTPADDSIIVETLPAASDPLLRELAARRRELLHASGAARQDMAAVVPVVREYIEAARRSGDPRYLGQAQQLLQPWENDFAAGHPIPVDIQVLHATVLQSLHRFNEALAELDAAIRQSPQNPQALLTRATVLQVRGRFAEAQMDCARLSATGVAVPATLCLAGVAGLTGRSAAAAKLLQPVLQSIPDSDHNLRGWTLTLLAEQAERGGDTTAASEWFRQALQNDPQDRYVRAAWSDLLLDVGQSAKVMELTNGYDADDNLLLRRALAMAQLKDPQRDAVLKQLRERFDLQHQRGDAAHLREESIMRLALEHDAAGALKLARLNWQQQREPADARVLFRAARASADTATLRELQEWVRQNGLQDHQLNFGGTRV